MIDEIIEKNRDYLLTKESTVVILYDLAREQVKEYGNMDYLQVYDTHRMYLIKQL